MRTQGYTYSGSTQKSSRNDLGKLHNDLVPFSELEEAEKDYDRNTAPETLKLIQKLGYKITKD